MIEHLQELSPPVLLLVALNGLGYALKKSPIPNWLIPWALLLAGAVVYPFIAEVGKVSFCVRNPLVFNCIIGFCIGLGAVGGNQLLRQSIERSPNGDEPKK